MKRILDSFARENAPDQIQLYFFFHRRGSQLQYTQIGMLQTLSHQLMCQVGLARTMCDVAWAEKKRVQGGEIHARNWRLEELLDLFSMIVVAAVEKQEFKILVDALDEAGEEAAKDSLYCFHGLSNDISETQARIGGLDIWVDKENHKDIATFPVAELHRQLVQDAGHRKALDVLQAKLIRKAPGVFLWVALMFPVKRIQRNGGEFLHSILENFNQVPSDLSQIYEYILTRVVNAEKQPRTLRFMQWIFFAQRPLNAVRIVHALACDDIPVRWSQISVEDLVSTANYSQVEKLVLSLSGGLAEIEHGGRWGKDHVQFVHESVNDFWRNDQFRCLGFTPRIDQIGESHYDLCVFCLDYLELSLDIVPDDEDRSLREGLEDGFPFFPYAASTWLIHANKAELRSISLAGLLPRLNGSHPGFFKRLIWGASRYLPDFECDLFRGATLLHLAAAFGLESLRRAFLETGAEVNRVDCGGNAALVFGAAYQDSEGASNKACVQVLLDYGADINAPLSEETDSPLSAAVKLGDEAVVRFLIEHGADVDAFVRGMGHHTNVTPLEAAVKSRKIHTVAIACILLDSGADVNQRRQHPDGHGDRDPTLLDKALDKGQEEMVQLLLERGADEYGFVRLFLEHGAHVNVDADELLDTALGVAAKSGSQSLMRMLLEAGADVFRRTRWYGTVYQIAKRSEHDSEAKVRLLLEFRYGRRWALRSGISLARTAEQGSEAMLRMLLLAKVDKAREGYTALLRLAKGSDVEREGKVKLLLQYRYGARWLNSDWTSAASSFRRSEGFSEESDG